MLDIKLIRDHEDTVRQGLKARNASLEVLDIVVADDAQRRKLVTEVETLKNQRNVVSKEIGMLKSKGQGYGSDSEIHARSRRLDCAERR